MSRSQRNKSDLTSKITSEKVKRKNKSLSTKKKKDIFVY